jgi:hypothetical protein
MSAVTVTSTIGASCHYWFTPQAIESPTGGGVTAPAIVHGAIYPNTDGTPATLSVALDAAYAWDVDLTFKNAPPVTFQGFQPGTGGDLLELLTAQGWVAL